MADPTGSPMGQARLKISQVDAQTPPLDAERTSRLTAKQLSRDELATLLSELLHARDLLIRQLQDVETRVFVVTRAVEMHSYRESGKRLP